MKKLFLLFFVLFISFSYGQTEKKETTIQPLRSAPVISNDDNAIYSPAGVEVMPKFPGGSTKMFEFINKSFVTPVGDLGEKIKGKVFVSFVVEKDGTLSDIRILRDIGYGTGKEAVRVLKLMPKWAPGIQNGREIRCTYSIPISVPQ